ncbi:hypothetical protein NEMBOFW57_004085 [Staphylotrichum longicolle]|uniref:dUTPase n=1 Tax=Staphylotrichum longicolle TaxID=669026 RepID=A0AAD4F799_9PEZI|nr:hypothetical protein NEMBOFW57_004085 [Staphylotrichum longicolle]
MLLTGATLLQRSIIRSLPSPALQLQPCGIDLTLHKILRWTSPGTIDLDNSRRQSAATALLPFPSPDEGLRLPQGAYLVQFNEAVDMPRDCMGQIFGRSSLWRAGVTVTAGVVDAGYQGVLGAMLDVRNPEGVVVFRGARLGQIVVHAMEGEVEGYKGVYQGAGGVEGREGLWD